MMRVMGRQFTRRGVSVIIASLLLIAIAVAAAVLLYVFSIGLMGSLGSSGGQQTKDEVILEAYSWTKLTSLILDLKNVGSSTVNLAAGSADYFVNGNAIKTVSACPGAATLAPGAPACTVTLTTPTLTSGVAYPVKVILPDGGVFSYTATAGYAS
jgi:flagellin-like protein